MWHCFDDVVDGLMHRKRTKNRLKNLENAMKKCLKNYKNRRPEGVWGRFGAIWVVLGSVWWQLR